MRSLNLIKKKKYHTKQTNKPKIKENQTKPHRKNPQGLRLKAEGAGAL